MIKKIFFLNSISSRVLLCSCGINSPGAGFTVTYDANGATEGSVPVDTNAYHTGDIVIVAGNPGGLKNPDFEFIGCCAAADCNAEPFIEGYGFLCKMAKVID